MSICQNQNKVINLPLFRPNGTTVHAKLTKPIHTRKIAPLIEFHWRNRPIEGERFNFAVGSFHLLQILYYLFVLFYDFNHRKITYYINKIWKLSNICAHMVFLYKQDVIGMWHTTRRVIWCLFHVWHTSLCWCFSVSYRWCSTRDMKV